MMYKVATYQSSYKEQWNAFLRTAREHLFFFDRDFMEYHSDRFTDASLMIFDNNRLVAIFPASIHNQLIKSHVGLTYGGLIVHENERLSAWKELLKVVIDYYKNSGIEKIIIKHIPSFYCKAMNDELLFIQNEYDTTIEIGQTSVLDMRKPHYFSNSILRYAKKALKNGVEIKQSDDYEQFWKHLLIPKLQNKFRTQPVHTLEEILLLKQRFPENIQLFGAFYDNQMIAGIVFFLFEKVQKVQYVSGGMHEINKCGGLQLLHKHCIESCEKDYFDLGTSIEPSTQKLNEGLFQWKEHCGAELFSTFVVSIHL